MNSMIRLCRSSLSRRLWVSIMCALLMVLVATAINVAGIRALGGVRGWENWLDQHRVHFLAWRLCLYVATAYGWWWMRTRVLLRESDTGTQARFHRVEAATVIVVLALETTSWLQAP